VQFSQVWIVGLWRLLHGPRLALVAKPLTMAMISSLPPDVQPGQRDVDLPVIHPVADRPERLPQTCAQLVAVRGLLRQHRQRHFLLHERTSLTVRWPAVI
jgi:hypothetical protein